jgi:hypothetical protein
LLVGKVLTLDGQASHGRCTQEVELVTMVRQNWYHTITAFVSYEIIFNKGILRPQKKLLMAETTREMKSICSRTSERHVHREVGAT